MGPPMKGDDTRAAMLLALAGFALLSVGDAVVKTMANAWPPPAIATLRYLLGASGLAAILLHQGGRAAFVRRLHRDQRTLVAVPRDRTGQRGSGRADDLYSAARCDRARLGDLR